MTPERRYIPLADLGDDGLGIEERDGSPPKIRGIAPPWESLSVDLGGFREKFAPTAFDKILSKKRLDVPMLFNHDDSSILARTTNGTLRISKEDRGLAFEADPVPTADTEKVLTLIRTKTIFGSSFAFSVGPKGETFEQDDRGNLIRTITEASGLWDVSPVTRAAYPTSSLGLRSIEAWKAARGVVVERAAKGLQISIDFDSTFTAAPGLWRSFIQDATAEGSRVCCITRRPDTPEDRAAVQDAFGDVFDALSAVVLCGPDSSKRSAAEAAGIAVDIWIDDSPQTVDQASARSIKVSSLVGARAAAAAAAARMIAEAS